LLLPPPTEQTRGEPELRLLQAHRRKSAGAAAAVGAAGPHLLDALERLS
jgi:hypothetical protein